MKISLEEGEWGFYVDPLTFIVNKIEGEIPESAFVVMKGREHIEDIGRTVIQTTFGYVENNTFLTLNKRDLAKKMSLKCAEYILRKEDFPPKVTLEREIKLGKDAYLAFSANKYDVFHLKISKEMLRNKDPKKIIEEIMNKSEKNLLREEEEDKRKLEYAKSSRAKCRKCGENIVKDMTGK